MPQPESTSKNPLRIGIVTGEVSGDLLGAKLISALQNLNPNISFEGVPGPEMVKAGCKALFPMERLAVMGVVDVLAKLPELFSLNSQLAKHFIANPPDVFIGIDAPDFNLPLELKLKRRGIPTVHYNSPSVWAWRRGRLKKIAKATDLMLTLFPFEAKFYEDNAIPVCFVGHSFADDIALIPDKTQAREFFGFSPDDEVIAILPGSRASEIRYLAKSFLETAKWCLLRRPNLRFITPVVNQTRKKQFTEILQQVAPDLPITIVEGNAREAMTAADAVLTASGTATLEAMLLKRPMVVAYRFAWLNYWIARMLVRVPYFALPNLLAKQTLVPEFFQDAVTPENLGPALLKWLESPASTIPVIEKFTELHKTLRRNAANEAAKAVFELIP